VRDVSGREVILGSAGHAADGGLATFGPDALAAMEAIDAAVVRRALDTGASELALPPLLRVEDLARIDYLASFPHLGNAVAAISPSGLDPRDDHAVAPGALEAADHLLPSAACYGVYFGLAGAEIERPLMRTVRGQCFRREEAYDGLRRLRAFTMREVVYVGSRDGAAEHVRDWERWTLELAAEHGIEVSVGAAADPFYDPEGSRALLQRLAPVKREVTAFGEVAIASLNVHRNFFGERLSIHFDGEPAFTSCAGFGLERWLWARERGMVRPEWTVEG
jgi:hypothetical protein